MGTRQVKDEEAQAWVEVSREEKCPAQLSDYSGRLCIKGSASNTTAPSLLMRTDGERGLPAGALRGIIFSYHRH